MNEEMPRPSSQMVNAVNLGMAIAMLRSTSRGLLVLRIRRGTSWLMTCQK
ncbi:hypothetical protein ACWFPY_35170 [Nocardia fluminea]